tara:strand:+ start:70 stop:594 length:525 start_codon:yes stop_codon:yes gene_type:complete
MPNKKIPKFTKPQRSIPKKKQVVSAPTAGPETIKKMVGKIDWSTPSYTTRGGGGMAKVTTPIPSTPPPSKKPPRDSIDWSTIEKPKGPKSRFTRENPWGGSKGGRVGKSSGGRTKKRQGGWYDDTSTPVEPRQPKPKPKKQRGYGQASDGRTRKAHGGSVASRLSKAGPVGKPN